MPIDPLLSELIGKAAEKFDVPKELLESIVVEERLRRYQPRGERRFLDQKLEELLEDYLKD